MSLDPKRLRRLFAAGAVLALLLVAAFYLSGVWRVSREVKEVPPSIPSDVARSAKGFTFSKAQGDRTLFTVRAASYEEYKQGSRARLHDVSIVIYGQQDNRTDRIYGSDFEYDPVAGDVTAQGDVHIDLEANTTEPGQPGQTPAPGMKNLIHLKTSGVVFNTKSGVADTRERIEFRVPEANGSAIGAHYDSHQQELKLLSAVWIDSTGDRQATVLAEDALITRDPRRIVLHSAEMRQPGKSMRADGVTLFLRDDNSLEKTLAAGDVRIVNAGKRPFTATGPRAELEMTANQQLRSGVLSGGISFEAAGSRPAHGTAQRVLLDFGPKSRLLKAHGETTDITQGPPEKSQQVRAPAMDLDFGARNRLEKAVTSGAASQILLKEPGKRTTITATQFQAAFTDSNRLKTVTGSPDAKIVFSSTGKPDQVTTSREFTANFTDQNTIESLEQSGDFHYQQGQRTATAQQARYSAATEDIELAGSPRLAETGTTMAADTIHVNRKTEVLNGQGSVKVTYMQLKAQPSGGMLGSADPIHVTGDTVTANRSTARFTNARLWQGANIVEAPDMAFDRDRRSLQAQSNGASRVNSVFLQNDRNGKAVPVNVTADKLSYVDSYRKAVFSGNVVVHGQEMTMQAADVQILLQPRGAQGDSQLDRIIASGAINIQQNDRRATGDQLVYTAKDEKFVLTASNGRLPSIFDAEHGQITGDSLTFFTHDDRVLVESRESSQILKNKVQDASKK